MANADSTAGSQVRTNQKDERQLSDDLSALLTKARGICGVLRFIGDLDVPSAELGNAMWAVQDMLDEAKEITDQLHEVYSEMEQSSNSLKTSSSPTRPKTSHKDGRNER